MCKRLTPLCVLLFLSFCLLVPVFAQDAQACQDKEQVLNQTSLLIKSKLQDLKTESDYMKQQLIELSASLKTSDLEQQRLKQQSMKLSSSLQTINESLNNSYLTIHKYEQKLNLTIRKYEQKLKYKNKILNILLIIVITRICTTVIGYIFYSKGIRLPRWLDILL